MPDDIAYRVTEATLVKRGDGSAWRLTFTPEPGTGGKPVDVILASGQVDSMYFEATYTREEIAVLDVEGLT